MVCMEKQKHIIANYNPIDVGDVVKLKSGSHLMTIADIRDYYKSGKLMANCQWFVGNDLYEKLFYIHQLEKVEKRDKNK